MLEDLRPVLAHVPRDARGRVNLDRHHLADLAALNDDDDAADAPALAAPLLSPHDVLPDEGVAVGHVRPRDNVGTLDRESKKGLASDRSPKTGVYGFHIRTDAGSPTRSGGS